MKICDLCGKRETGLWLEKLPSDWSFRDIQEVCSPCYVKLMRVSQKVWDDCEATAVKSYKRACREWIRSQKKEWKEKRAKSN